MTSKKAINVYVASLVGNNTHAYYKQSHGYIQLLHALSNNHDLYRWSSNLRDIKSRYKFELTEAISPTVCMGARLSSSRYSLISFRHGLGLHPLSSRGMQQNVNLVAYEIHLIIACLCCQKRRWNSDYIHVLLDELWKYSCLWSTLGQYSCTVTYKQLCLIRTLLTQKIYLLTMWFLKVGGGMGQGSATEVTHLNLQCMVALLVV